MKVYISGISGTAMGPLAIMAKEAGMEVCGSDKNAGAVTPELEAKNIRFEIGAQDGGFLRAQNDAGKIDWFVYTSALPKDHAELLLAQELGIKVSKRDEFIAYLVEELGLKMVAVAGTHGKTTTTSAIIWAALKLGLPVAWLVGTTLGFAEAGCYHEGAKFLVYEADEYDRNFLYYHPWLSIITVISYDHPDIYKTRYEYIEAFEQFKAQSETVIENYVEDNRINLAGAVRRQDVTMAMEAVKKIATEIGQEIDEAKLVEIMNDFPGVGRRFERLAEGIYTDYAHHPEEIAATMNIAREEAELRGFKGVVAVYEPHQNTRQHEVKYDYPEAFVGADKIFWLPTYLTRENPDLKVLTPADFIGTLANKEVAEPAEMNDELLLKLQHLREEGYLILLMTAGPADKTYREYFSR